MSIILVIVIACLVATLYWEGVVDKNGRINWSEGIQVFFLLLGTALLMVGTLFLAV
jgi:hypothetical protein